MNSNGRLPGMSENPILVAVEKQDWLQPIQDTGQDLVEKAFEAAGQNGPVLKDALHGTWLGHPLHPAITDVPVGSWTVALVLDLLEVRGSTEYQAGADAAVVIGLVSSVPAALSGLTDWSSTRGKPLRVGALHGVLNLSAAALYARSYAARKSDNRATGRWLSFVGYGLLMASAYLGGELSYSQGVGVKNPPES